MVFPLVSSRKMAMRLMSNTDIELKNQYVADGPTDAVTVGKNFVMKNTITIDEATLRETPNALAVSVKISGTITQMKDPIPEKQ